ALGTVLALSVEHHPALAFLDQIGPPLLLGDRGVDILRQYDLVTRLARPVTGLDRELGDVEEARGQLALMVTQPRSMLDDSRDGRAVEGAQSAVLDEPAGECGVSWEG